MDGPCSDCTHSENVADPHGRIECEAIWFATHEPGSRLVSFPYILQGGTRGMTNWDKIAIGLTRSEVSELSILFEEVLMLDIFLVPRLPSSLR